MVHSGGWHQLLIQMVRITTEYQDILTEESLMQLRRIQVLFQWKQPQHVRWKIRVSNNNWCAWNYVNARPASIAGLLTHVLCVKDGSQSSGKILLHTSRVLQTHPLAAWQRSLYEMN